MKRLVGSFIAGMASQGEPAASYSLGHYPVGASFYSGSKGIDGHHDKRVPSHKRIASDDCRAVREEIDILGVRQGGDILTEHENVWPT
jgi:hypothetical protein